MNYKLSRVNEVAVDTVSASFGVGDHLRTVKQDVIYVIKPLLA